jgi:hypothetical protein
LLPVPEFVPENLVGPGFGYNGKIYAANPCESQGTSMRIYDPVMNSWTETESLSPVSGTLAGLRRSRLYGGKIYYWCSGTEAPSRIVVFDIATLTWDATVYEVDDGGGVGNPYVGLKEGYRAYYTVSLSGWGHNGGAIVDFLTRKTFTIDSYFIVSGGYQKRWAMEVAGKVYWLADGEYVG